MPREERSVSDTIELLRRFPQGATVMADGRVFAPVNGSCSDCHGRWDTYELDAPDADLPWLAGTSEID